MLMFFVGIFHCLFIRCFVKDFVPCPGLIHCFHFHSGVWHFIPFPYGVMSSLSHPFRCDRIQICKFLEPSLGLIAGFLLFGAMSRTYPSVDTKAELRMNRPKTRRRIHRYMSFNF